MLTPFPVLLQSTKVAIVLPVEAVFVTAEAIETGLFIGITYRRGGVFAGEGGGRARGIAFDTGGFESPEAHLPPASNDHGFDEAGFDGALGLELPAKPVAEAIEAVLGFAFEEHGAGEESVADGVAGAAGFAFGGDGSAGFGAVATADFGAGFFGEEWCLVVGMAHTTNSFRDGSGKFRVSFCKFLVSQGVIFFFRA